MRPAAQLLALGGLIAAFGGCGDAETRSDPARGGEPSATAPTGSTSEQPETIEDAYRLVEENDFPGALVIAGALGGSAPETVGRRIADRIGQRATAAVRRGNRSGARRLLRRAGEYPTTRAVSSARTQLRDAEQRANARRKAAAERAQEAEDATVAPAEPEPSSAPSGTCAEAGATDFAVPPGDPRDRDGDGIACES